MLPLFPLKLIPFPFESLNLHIFEPRYRQLFQECEEDKITFGIPSVSDKKMKYIGTEMKLIKIEKRYPDGRLDVKTEGIGIFKIKKFYSEAPGKLYAGGEIERINFDLEGDYGMYEEILIRMEELYQIMQIKKELPALNADFNTYRIAHLIGLSAEQEFKLLNIFEEKNRQDFILTHLEKLLPIVREMEELRKKVQMNGHFRRGEW